MTCIVCGANIPRGKRYQGEKYNSLHFCSEACFKRYCNIKSKPLSKSRPYVMAINPFISLSLMLTGHSDETFNQPDE